MAIVMTHRKNRGRCGWNNGWTFFVCKNPHSQVSFMFVHIASIINHQWSSSPSSSLSFFIPNVTSILPLPFQIGVFILCTNTWYRRFGSEIHSDVDTFSIGGSRIRRETRYDTYLDFESNWRSADRYGTWSLAASWGRSTTNLYSLPSIVFRVSRSIHIWLLIALRATIPNMMMNWMFHGRFSCSEWLTMIDWYARVGKGLSRSRIQR